MNFKQIQKEKTAQIETVLKRYLPKVEGQQKLVMDAMQYSMLSGGKRLRPMLMQETYHLFGGTTAVIEPFMAAIEMIHTYSLVHDDLPAMDDDEYRRGRKTTHVVYGEDMGILTGDGLLNFAFETAALAFDMEPENSFCIGKALQVLGRKAGIYGMIGGQVVDVKSSGEEDFRGKAGIYLPPKDRRPDRSLYDDRCDPGRSAKRKCAGNGRNRSRSGNGISDPG